MNIKKSKQYILLLVLCCLGMTSAIEASHEDYAPLSVHTEYDNPTLQEKILSYVSSLKLFRPASLFEDISLAVTIANYRDAHPYCFRGLIAVSLLGMGIGTHWLVKKIRSQVQILKQQAQVNPPPLD